MKDFLQFFTEKECRTFFTEAMDNAKIIDLFRRSLANAFGKQVSDEEQTRSQASQTEQKQFGHI